MATKTKKRTAAKPNTTVLKLQAEVSRLKLAVKALDDARDIMMSGSLTEGDRDRFSFDRADVLRDSIEAWRLNPIARRIVELTTQYTVGGGIIAESKHEATNKFIHEFWNHRLNRMPIRAMELCDELTRTGNLFIAISTGPDGMSYVRAIPASYMAEIESRDNDVEQPTKFTEHPRSLEPEPKVWNAYDEATDARNSDGTYPTVMVQYTINRPAGAQWGESDLAPMLKWLQRYTSWLEDRVRLNHWRQVFMYIIRGIYESEEERKKRQAELNANPPKSGSVLVTNANEAWGILNPQLDSFNAAEDGLVVKKTIAAGAGVPLHFLAEPEGSNKTTAEAAGGPTFRHYQQRQILFLWIVKDILSIVIRRRALLNNRVKADAEINVTGTDISARDNAALAIASSTIIAAWVLLYEKGFVDQEEVLRIAYMFAGENADIQELLKKVVPERTPTTKPSKGANAPDTKIDTATGDVKGAAEI